MSVLANALPLNELTTVITKGTTPTTIGGKFSEEGINFIKVENMTDDGRFDFSKRTFIDEDTNSLLKRSVIQNGDVLFTIAGTIGRVCIVTEAELPANTNQAVGIIRPDRDKLDKHYLYYWLRDKKTLALVNERTVQAVQANFSLTGIRELCIPHMSVEEQHRTILLLKTLDDKIALNRKLNETLEGMARALFQSWFVDFDPVKAKLGALRHGRDPERACMAALSGKLRIAPGRPKPDTLEDQLPTVEEIDAAIAELESLNPSQKENLAQTAAHFPAAFQESELGLVPEGWQVSKIEDLVKRYPVGKKYSQKTAQLKGNIPILDQGKSGIIGFHNDSPGVTATPDDPMVVFANHTCYMRLIMHDFSAIQNVLPFKGEDRNIFWVYCATYGQQEFVEYKGHWPDFAIKEIVKPSKDLCEYFGGLVRDLFVNIFELENQSRTLTELRDTLLPKLLSGELPVGEASDTVEAAVES